MFKTIRKMMVLALAVSAMQVFGGDDLAECRAAMEKALAQKNKNARRSLKSSSTRVDRYYATGDYNITVGEGTLSFNVNVTKKYSRIKSALLVIDAWDVDFPYATEDDRVFFNSGSLGRLYGDNETYSEDAANHSRFPVPVSWIYEGNNSFVIYVDVGNGGWVTGVREAWLEIEGSDPDVPAVVDIVSPYFDGERDSGGGRPAWFLSGVDVDVPIKIRCDAGETKVVGCSVTYENQTQYKACNGEHEFQIDLGKVNVGAFKPGYKMEVKLKGANEKWSEPFKANFFIAEKPYYGWWKVVEERFDSVVYGPIIANAETYSIFSDLNDANVILDPQSFINLNWKMPDLKWKVTPKIKCGLEMSSEDGLLSLSAEVGRSGSGANGKYSKNLYTGYLISSKKGNPSLSDYIKFLGGYNVLMKIGEYELYSGLRGRITRRWDDNCSSWRWNGGDGALHLYGSLGLNVGLPPACPLVSVGGKIETDVSFALTFDKNSLQDKLFLRVDGDPLIGADIYGQVSLSGLVALRGGERLRLYYGRQLLPARDCDKWGYQMYPYWEIYVLGGVYKGGTPNWKYLTMGEWWIGGAAIPKTIAHRLSASGNDCDNYDVQVRNKQSGYKALTRDYASETELMPIDGTQNVRSKAAARLMGASLLSAGSQNVVEEDTLIASGYPMPTPTTATSAAGDAVAFVRDNVSRGAVDRTEVMVQRNVDGKWEASESVWNDGTADFAPSMATLDDGTIIVVWQNLKQTYGETVDIEQMMSDSEIAVAMRNPSTGAWSHTNLTANAVVDHSPKVAVAPDGTAMVMWIRNGGNEILGTAEHPDKLYYARYANGAWGNETLLPTEGCTMLSTDIAMSQNGAIVTYTVDMDGTLEAGTDQELFALTINYSSVNNVRITNDELTDIRGSVRIGNDGEPVFVWSSAGTVVWKNGWMGATNSVLTNATKVVTDFSVSPVAPDGKIAIAFSSDGAEGMHTDPYLLVYDPVNGQWGEGLRIVENVAYEGNYSPAWDANGNVFMSYASYNTEKDANDYVQTKSADVKTIRFPIGADPAISTEDIYFTTNVLTVGEVVHVEAVIRNKGTLTARNVGVTVKDTISGTVFSGTIGEIPGGGEYVYGFDWTVGDSIMSDLLDFEFTLTPDVASIDKDVSNNHVHWRGPEANVGIASAFAREQETNSKLLCARVRNFGFRKSTEGMKVTFRRGSASGTVLGVVDVPALNSGRENEFEARYSWDLSGLTFETNMVEMVALLSDEKGTVVETFPFIVEVKSIAEEEPVVPKEPLYMVIDLSGGTNAVHFPISFLDDVPQGGWTDEYKTEKLVLRRIEAGTFTMGSPEDEVGRENMCYDETLHAVTLTKPFYTGVFEITQKQWELVCGDNSRPSGWRFPEPRHPADNVSFNDIRGEVAGASWPEHSSVDNDSFLGILRRKTAIQAFDLPTEAQWEYACRAGTSTSINSGKNLLNPTNDMNMAEVARYNFNMYEDGYSIGIYGYHTAIVGSYLPNSWGLYDMHGNVWEWCLDWASWRNMGDDEVDPLGPSSTASSIGQRITRGGDYCNYAYHARSAARYSGRPSGENAQYGFRIVCIATEEVLALDANDNMSVHVALVGDETEFSDYQVGQMFGTLPTPTSKNGLPFLGWFTSDGTQVTPTTIVSTDHAQLFAKWDYSSTMEWKIQNEGGTYMVIDLSGGPNAANYPIFYLDDVPAGGWTDEYKTTKLVLKRISAGSWGPSYSTHSITKDFYMGVFELTQKQWQLVMGDSSPRQPDDSVGIGDTFPMYYIYYVDMRGDSPTQKWPISTEVANDSFLSRLRLKTHIHQFDLPTRSQRYLACGTYDQESLISLSWYKDNSGAKVHAVGERIPNSLGLYDVYGNVTEWSVDWWGPAEHDVGVDEVGAFWDFTPASNTHFWVYPEGGSYTSPISELTVTKINTGTGYWYNGARLCLTTGGHVIYDAPVITTNSGLKTFPMTVEIDNPNMSGTVVYYTTDGSDPAVTNGVLYTGPFELAGPATVKAFVHGISDSLKSRDSLVVSQTYYDSINDLLGVDFGEWTTDETRAWMPDGNGGMYSTGLTNGQSSAIHVQLSGTGILEFDVSLLADGTPSEYNLPYNLLYMRSDGEAVELPSEELLLNSSMTNKHVSLSIRALSNKTFTVSLRHVGGASSAYPYACYFDRVHLSNVTWTPYDYQITLDANDGSGDVTNVVAHYGCKMPPATAPTRAGYTFAGYYDAVDGGTKYYTASMESAKDWDGDKDATLYARWVANVYRVTLNNNDGTTNSQEMAASYGEPLPWMSPPTRIGYTFVGYFDTPSQSGGTQYYGSHMESLTQWDKACDSGLFARWMVNTYTVILDGQGGSGGSTNVTVTFGSTMPGIVVPTRDGYKFGGYYTLAGGKGTQYYADSGTSVRMWDKTITTTLYAHWTRDVCFHVENGVLKSVDLNDCTEVTIPNTVTSIGTYAFRNCDAMTHVTINGFVTNISPMAFFRCNGLTSVSFSEGLVSIGDSAFYGCWQLSGVVRIPDSVRDVGSVAFCSCSNITSVVISDGVTNMGNRAFAYCTGMKNLSFGRNVMRCPSAFEGCVSLTELILPEGLKCAKPKDYAHDYYSFGGTFRGCSTLEKVVVPSTFEYGIGDGMFAGCSALHDVTLAEGVKAIGANTFYGCSSLSQIVLPASMGFVDAQAFTRCGEDAFEVIYAEGTKYIYDASFWGCQSLTKVTIPASVSSVGDGTYYNCSNLTCVVFLGNAPYVTPGTFHGVNSNCVAYVQRGSKGWGVHIPGTWNGIRIEYANGPIGYATGIAPSEATVEDGGAVTVRVTGGTQDSAASVKVYLTYNTAVAADVDLANGKVDGVTPKGGLKFPVSLSWEKGEIGDRVITIPIKADKVVEFDEFFTLQLGDAVGMELGEDRVCTVTIHDSGYDSLAKKVVDGTATKTELTTWNKLQTAKAPYVCGLPDPANAGKVTGSALCAVGKKVTLKATANKGFVFTGWQRADVQERIPPVEATPDDYIATTPSLVIDRSTKPTANSKTSTTVIGTAEDATYYACFITVDEDRAAITLNVDGQDAVATQVLTWTNYCGVAVNWPIASSGLSATTVKVAGLPTGMKFTDKPITSKIGTGTTAVTVTNVMPNTIYGAPTAASKVGARTGTIEPSKVKFTVTTTGKTTETFMVNLVVLPIPDWAQGTFVGSVKYIIESMEREESYGLATMTVAANGNISGKIALDGTNWTFSAASFSRVEHVERIGGEVVTNFIVEAEAKAGKATKPVTLEVAANALAARSSGGTDGSSVQSVALAGAMAEGTFGDCEASLWRNVWKDKATAATAKEAIAKWEGVYTVAMASRNDGCAGCTTMPGCGYLSLTVGKDGNVKAAGKLADGTSVSATSPLMYDEDAGWFVYLYAAPAAYKGGAFAAAAGFEPEDGVQGTPICRLSPVLFTPQWTSRSPEATGAYGKGFSRKLDLIGAYYDKAKRLDDYYESLKLQMDTAPQLGFTFKETTLGDNNKKLIETRNELSDAVDTFGQDGMTVTVDEKGAIVIVKETKPVQDATTKKWSYNGANDGALTLSFTQATGIFKGTYTFWYDYMSAYDGTKDRNNETWTHTSKKVNFEGVKVQGEDEMGGFYLWDATGEYEDAKTGKTKTYKYKLSFPVRLMP